MKKKFYFLFLLIFFGIMKSQDFFGQIHIKERNTLYQNQIFITNLSTHYTAVCDANGSFKIPAKIGDILRITSLISQRKDLKVTERHLKTDQNYIEIELSYREIPEVVIKFRPTGVLKKDIQAIKDPKRKIEIANIVGLPESKGDGYAPPPSFSLGTGIGATGVVEHLYDVFSGNIHRKKRLKDFEIMDKNIKIIKKYFGINYFKKVNIPEHLIDDFLTFVYKSDDIKKYIDAQNIDATQPYIEKYLPIYTKRLKDSKLINKTENNH